MTRNEVKILAEELYRLMKKRHQEYCITDFGGKDIRYQN